MISSGYHIVTGIALLFWSAIGRPSVVSFVSVQVSLFWQVINHFLTVALRVVRCIICWRTVIYSLSFPCFALEHSATLPAIPVILILIRTKLLDINWRCRTYNFHTTYHFPEQGTLSTHSFSAPTFHVS